MTGSPRLPTGEGREARRQERGFPGHGGAQQAILFLVFQPGEPSVVDQAGDLQAKNPGLFVHGAAAIDDQFGFWERELLKSSPGAHAAGAHAGAHGAAHHPAPPKKAPQHK